MAISARDSVLAVVPMFHANAWGLPFAAPAAGAKLVLPGPPYRRRAASRALINAEARDDRASASPTVWLGLVEHLDATGGEAADAGAASSSAARRCRRH